MILSVRRYFTGMGLLNFNYLLLLFIFCAIYVS